MRKGLQLVRKAGDKIFIHDEGETLIEITVQKVTGSGKVTLAFRSDPEEFDIDRGEVYRARYPETKK